MANSNFIVRNGLEVGNLTISATTGDIVTSGNIVVVGQGTVSGGGAGAAYLSQLADVNTVTPAPSNGQSLVWNSGTSKWVAGTVSGGAGSTAAADLTGTTLASGVTASSLTSVGTLGSLSVTGAATAGSVVSGNLTMSGDSISSTNSTISIDPATAGTGGLVIIAGNLQVTGTTTTINSTTVTTTELNIEVATDAINAAAANGGGLTVNASGANATLTYTSADDRWNMNKNLNVGTVYGALVGNASTATALATPRNINGVAFDGSANITIPTGVLTSDNNTFTKAQRGAVVALTAGTTVTPDFALSNNFSLAPTQSFTMAFPTNVVAGQSGMIVITQDATGSRVVTWASGWVAAGGTKPVLSTAANSVDYISYYVETTGRIFVSLIANVS
jgi:hypothetical protein